MKVSLLSSLLLPAAASARFIEANEANRRDMEEWQAIFGDGFKAVFAVERKGGIVFKTLAGERVSLDDL